MLTLDEAIDKVFLLPKEKLQQDGEQLVTKQCEYMEDIVRNEKAQYLVFTVLPAMCNDLLNYNMQKHGDLNRALAESQANLMFQAIAYGIAIGIQMEKGDVNVND